jgi:hypothetical protein
MPAKGRLRSTGTLSPQRLSSPCTGCTGPTSAIRRRTGRVRRGGRGQQLRLRPLRAGDLLGRLRPPLTSTGATAADSVPGPAPESKPDPKVTPGSSATAVATAVARAAANAPAAVLSTELAGRISHINALAAGGRLDDTYALATELREGGGADDPRRGGSGPGGILRTPVRRPPRGHRAGPGGGQCPVQCRGPGGARGRGAGGGRVAEAQRRPRRCRPRA